MATQNRMYVPTHPGEAGNIKIKSLAVPIEDGITAFLAANGIAALFNKNTWPIVGGGGTYTSGQWNITTTGTGAAAAEATTPGGGILITTGSTSTFNTDLSSKQVWTPVADKYIAFAARIQVSHATQIGFDLGITNSQADPQTTDFTDSIEFRKAVGGATVVGRVRGDSGTAASTSTLLTMTAATEYEIGFYAKLNATAGNCQGSWFVGVTGGPYTETAFTANQRAQLARILTTPPSFAFNLSGKGTTGVNPTMTVTAALLQADN